MKVIYMDHSATTPTDPEVVSTMLPFFSLHYGNPSSLYSIAETSKEAMDSARSTIASFIHAQSKEIYFTSGGTESDNQAVMCTARRLKDKGKHIITTSIEHHAVLHACQQLEKEGFSVSYLPVDSYGMVSPDTLRKAVTSDTTLVSIMMANNEVGTIQDINALATIAHENGALFHTDAVQAIGKVPIHVGEMNIDMLSSSAHKLYGPKGIGFLYVKSSVPITLICMGVDKNERKDRERRIFLALLDLEKQLKYPRNVISKTTRSYLI